MITANSAPTRFIGMDIHKHYFTAVGVDADQKVIFRTPPGRPSNRSNPGPKRT